MRWLRTPPISGRSRWEISPPCRSSWTALTTSDPIIVGEQYRLPYQGDSEPHTFYIKINYFRNTVNHFHHKIRWFFLFHRKIRWYRCKSRCIIFFDSESEKCHLILGRRIWSSSKFTAIVHIQQRYTNFR